MKIKKEIELTTIVVFAVAIAQGVTANASTTTSQEPPRAIRPFQVHVSDEALTDLRRRIAATRWPEKETVTDNSQGVPLATIQ